MTRSARLARHADAAAHVAAMHDLIRREDLDDDGADVVDDQAVDVAALVPEQRSRPVAVPGPDGLRLAQLERYVEWCRSEQLRLVDRLRQGGATWDQIGTTCGITRQAAQQRYGSGSAARVAR